MSVSNRTFLRALRAVASPERARASARFFKSGKGQYGAGDRFLGVAVPAVRAVVRAHDGIALPDVGLLLASPWHEARLGGALLLVRRWERGDDAVKRETFDFYLSHLQGVNNWDIVDSSAAHVVGRQLLSGPASGMRLLDRLSRSRRIWDRRVAVVATHAFIRAGRLDVTFRLCDALLGDREDLMHKACGWMLREAGKKDPDALRSWLLPRLPELPRTTLRYAIEKFPEPERRRFLTL